MSRYRKDLGDFGEAAAAAYLKKKQYQILEKNYRTAGGELDLIARTQTHLIFCGGQDQKQSALRQTD